MTDWDSIKEEKQLNIDIATAWNTAKELVLANEYRQQRSNDLSGEELSARIKANFTSVFMTLREVRKSTATGIKTVTEVKKPQFVA